jgi:hypothetical protein
MATVHFHCHNLTEVMYKGSPILKVQVSVTCGLCATPLCYLHKIVCTAGRGGVATLLSFSLHIFKPYKQTKWLM